MSDRIRSPWADLAAQARALADLADQCAAKSAGELAPGDQGNPLADLDASALAVRGVVAACRRATWQALHDDGATYAEIGELWHVSKQAVRQALVAQDRPR
ncbi:hypothetical protein [Nocardia sp. NPDC055049]